MINYTVVIRGGGSIYDGIFRSEANYTFETYVSLEGTGPVEHFVGGSRDRKQWYRCIQR